MTITHHLNIEIKRTDAYIRKFNLFKERFAAAVTEFPDQFVFDTPDLAAAIDVAKASGLDYRVVHRFVPDDVDEFPAYKLTMPLVQPRSIRSRGFSIAAEQPSLKIVASRTVKEAL